MATVTTVNGANQYIAQYFIDDESWNEADDAKKLRIVNVANRTLSTQYPSYYIPTDAIYEFAGSLAIVFNDANKLQQHGVAGFSVTGVASFTFKENNVKTPGGTPMSAFIGNEVLDMINEAPENAELPKLGAGLLPRDVVM